MAKKLALETVLRHNKNSQPFTVFAIICFICIHKWFYAIKILTLNFATLSYLCFFFSLRVRDRIEWKCLSSHKNACQCRKKNFTVTTVEL